MTYNQIIGYFGSQAEAARRLGYSRETFRKWRTAGVPRRTQDRIQHLLAGKLKAGRRV